MDVDVVVKAKRKKSEKLVIQERDTQIFNYLDRVGYAKLDHITKFVIGLDDEKSQNAIMRRLYLLRRFEYLKTYSTHLGIYYALTYKSKANNQLISNLRFDQLPHHDFLLSLFHLVKDREVLTEREVLAKYKNVGKKGKIPDMVIDGWVIEYERTPKSNLDCKALLDYWVVDNNKRICIIYEDQDICNRYQRLITNPAKVILLSKTDYKNIISILNGADNTIVSPKIIDIPLSLVKEELTKPDLGVINIADKYR